MKEDITKQIDDLNEDLKVRHLVRYSQNSSSFHCSLVMRSSNSTFFATSTFREPLILLSCASRPRSSIDLLKGRIKNQIASFRKTITKVLDKDTSLGKKIRTLFREQGITIASILNDYWNGYRGTC